jgi:hypothetical protein
MNELNVMGWWVGGGGYVALSIARLLGKGREDKLSTRKSLDERGETRQNRFVLIVLGVITTRAARLDTPKKVT